MSETAAPAAPEAPAEGTPAPVEGQQKPPEADPLADYDALLKAKPLKYKAAGKERSVGSIKELLRKAEMADGNMEKVRELTEREARAAAIEARQRRIAEAKTVKERIEALREVVGDGFDEAAEEAVYERIQREKSLSQLTPAERAAKEEAEAYRAQLEKYEAAEAKRQQEEQAAREKAEDEALLNDLAGVTVKALQALKLPKTAAPDATRRLAALMHMAQQNGFNLEPSELASRAVQWARDDLRGYTEGLEGDALVDFLGEAVVRRAAKSWLAKVNGGAPPPPVQSAQPSKPLAQGERRNINADWRALMSGR